MSAEGSEPARQVFQAALEVLLRIASPEDLQRGTLTVTIRHEGGKIQRQLQLIENLPLVEPVRRRP